MSPSSVLPSSKWIKNPVIEFRQKKDTAGQLVKSKWCEDNSSDRTCTSSVASSFHNLVTTSVVLGREPFANETSVQVRPWTALCIAPNMASSYGSSDAVARSKQWMPTWNIDREADQDKVTKYRYEQDGANLIAPQLTWFSTLELADLNLGQCKGPGKERQDIEAMISTMLTKGSQSSDQARIGSAEDASYIKGWHSYLPSGEVPSASTVNTVKDSYVACDYAKGLTPGLLNGSNDKCDVGPNKLKIRRYTVFSSFHAYALATRKDPQFGQSCLACTSLFNGDERKACIRSNKVVYRGLASTNPLKSRDGCPDMFDAAAYERLRKYLQTFASIGENGIEMTFRPVLHQIDMSLTLQTFDFLDKRQTETTADLLTEQDENKKNEYPLIETARSGKISVIPDMDWTVNPKPWNSLDFVGGTKAVTNELVEDGRTGASMGLTMSLPDNLLDGICERKIPYDSNGGYDGGDVYQGSTKDGAFAATDAKHCTFLKDASHKADQRVECPKTGATDTRTQCSLSRQNKDCSPSDGKDNRLSGMQLVMSRYGNLPRAELSHEHRSGGRNSLKSISTNATGHTLKVGQGQCDEADKYTGKPCYFSQQYIGVYDTRSGATPDSSWEFADDMADTRKGMDTCYYADSTKATFCKSQLLLAKEGSCAAGQNDADRNACQIVYGQEKKQDGATDNDKNKHVWTMSDVPNLNFWEFQSAFNASETKARLGLQVFKHYNTEIWRYTSNTGASTVDAATGEPLIRPTLHVYAWFSTCSKDSDAAACTHDSDIANVDETGNSTALLNKANMGHDGGRRMTVMTKTNNPLTLQVNSTWTNHDFGNSKAGEIEWLESNARDKAYNKAVAPTYWTTNQPASGMATFDDKTRNGVSLLYEQEERNNQTSLSKAYAQKAESLARLVQTEISNAVKYGDQHLWEATLHFEAKNATGQWEPANDLWKVERYNAGSKTSSTISDFKSYGNREQVHTLLSDGYDHQDGVRKFPTYTTANHVYDNYMPTTCNVTNTTECQRLSYYQQETDYLFLRKGHDQGLEARTRFIHGGDLCTAGSETDCSRKLSIVPAGDMLMREVTVTLKVLMRTERLKYSDGTSFTPFKPSTAIMKLHMHPAATAPRMCTMHPSNPRQADKDINLCAKSELVNSNSAILKVDKEIDDFSVPSINAENEKRLHMMHYGVIPGMSGQGPYPLEEAPTAEDATRAHFKNESVYLTVRAKLPDRKFVLMRIDEAKNTTGPYMIPLDSYEDCPDQDRYADRTDFAKEAKKGDGHHRHQ